MNRSEMKGLIRGLNKDETSQNLNVLLDDAPDLTKKIYDIAMIQLKPRGVDEDTEEAIED